MDSILSPIILQFILLGITALISVAIRRLYLSPLAKFPGPKLAALTGLYEAYYSCFKDGGGRYFERIDRMHDKYGGSIFNPGLISR